MYKKLLSLLSLKPKNKVLEESSKIDRKITLVIENEQERKVEPIVFSFSEDKSIRLLCDFKKTSYGYISNDGRYALSSFTKIYNIAHYMDVYDVYVLATKAQQEAFKVGKLWPSCAAIQVNQLIQFDEPNPILTQVFVFLGSTYAVTNSFNLKVKEENKEKKKE